MINKVKRSFAIALQCKDSKRTLIISAVCALAAPLFMIFMDGFLFFGAILTVYGWMFITQFMQLPEIAEVSAASPLKKFMGTTMGDIITFVGCIYTTVCMIACHRIGKNSEQLLMAYLFIAAFTIYFSLIYRFYVGALVIMCSLILVGFGFFVAVGDQINLAFEMYDIIGASTIGFAWLLGVILRHALYKRPMAPMMRKALERQIR